MKLSNESCDYFYFDHMKSNQNVFRKIRKRYILQNFKKSRYQNGNKQSIQIYV